jgi:uncharacterized protein YcbK (DUF882 family)
MVVQSVASLLFFVVSPGQTVQGWRAPQIPGIYRVDGGKTALVGVPPAKLAARATGIGRYPGDVAPLLVPIKDQQLALPLSAHYRLADFLCKGHRGVVAVNPNLVAKLESLIGSLRSDGYQVRKLRLLSGFRTPGYNRAIGNRTNRSRHLHGDAADVLADDFNRDGRMDRKDAQILMAAVDRIDVLVPLRGGAAIYPPGPGHGWFVHTDTRGQSIRW